jgi:hypothetical protein
MKEILINIIDTNGYSCNTHSVARAAAGECCNENPAIVRTKKGTNTMFDLARHNTTRTYSELLPYVDKDNGRK